MKKNTKKLTSLLLTFAIAFSLAACGKENKHVDKVTTEIASSGDSEPTTEDEPSTPTTTDVEPDSAEALEEQESFDAYLEEQFEESVTNDTVTLHYTIADPAAYGIDEPEVSLGDTGTSDADIEEDLQELNEDISEIESFNYDLLTSEQKFTYDIMYDYMQTSLLSYDNIYLYEPFAYTSGLQSNLPINMAEYKFYDANDVEEYIELLNLVDDYVDDFLDFETRKSEEGLFMSASCADEVIRQCNEFIATPNSNLLIDTFNDKIEEVPNLTEEQKHTYIQQNHEAVMNSVIPAYESIISTFTTLHDTGTNDLGLCYYDGGTEYYEYLLKSKVGTDKTPDEVISALDTAINDRVSQLYQIVYANYESYSNYFEEYDSLYSDIDAEETIRFFEDEMADRFPEIDDINFTVENVHESLTDIVSPAFYIVPALDRFTDNSIYLNTGSDGSGSLWSTLCHEGIPGHMYQFVYYYSTNPYPIRTQLSFNGYDEGWATYVEHMSYEYYSGYSDPVYAELERINSELNILVSARIEIGVNYQGWTLEETEAYLTDLGFDASGAQDIMDYVIAEPANYQMYCTGWLEFEELKDYAETALGSDFHEAEFHKVILDAGPCQFYLLRQKVDNYISSY